VFDAALNDERPLTEQAAARGRPEQRREVATRLPQDRSVMAKGRDMALSDQLTKLAARAQELEDRAAAAKGKQKADLEPVRRTARRTTGGGSSC
jgi:hypothetical protein